MKFVLRIVSRVRFLGEVIALQFCFEINRPLVSLPPYYLFYTYY